MRGIAAGRRGLGRDRGRQRLVGRVHRGARGRRRRGPAGADRDQPRLRGRRQPRHRRHRLGVRARVQPRRGRAPRRAGRRWSGCCEPIPPSPSSGRASSRPTAPAIPRRAGSPPWSTRPATPCSATSSPPTASPAGTGWDTSTPRTSPTSTGCRARASWPGGAPSRSCTGSTSRTSCTPRTPTCAGGPGGPGGECSIVPGAVGHPPPGGLDRPPPLPDARRPSPLGLPFRGPDRAGVAAPGAAGHGGAPGAAARRHVRQAGPERAARSPSRRAE